MSLARSAFSLSAALCGYLLLAFAGSAAAGATDELLRLVPDDVGFCVVVQDLREHNERVAGSPLAKALRKSPLSKVPELQQLEALDQLFQKQFDMDLAKFRDDVLGDAIVFAYRPGPPGKQQEEQGLLLLRARDAKVLEKLVNKFNEGELQSGKLKELKEGEYQGQKYVRRVKPSGEDVYAIRGETLLLGTREEIFREALKRLGEDRKAATALQRALRDTGPGKPLASVWINPRAFDAELQHNLESSEGGEAAALRNFIRYWKAIDGVVLSLALDSDLYVNLSIQARTEDLPAAARKLIKAASQPTDLPGKLPEDALFACAGRVQLDALLEMFTDFLTPEDAKAFRDKADGLMRAAGGRKFFDDVLPNLGPECALAILAPPASEKDWFPHVFVALAAQPGSDKDKPADEAVLDAVNWAATTAVFAYNGLGGNPLTLKSMTAEKTKIKYIEGGDGLPPGLRPAFALQHGFLTLGSSPEAIQRAGAILSSKPAVRDSQPILWMSLKHMRKFLTDRREQVADYLAQKDKIDKKEAGRRLDGVLGLFEFIDRIELTHPKDGQFSLRVQMSLALK